MDQKYEKLSKIGEGSYGQVWTVKLRADPDTKTKFVMKLINLAKASAKERDYAEQEAKLLKNLKHPNIVTCKDTFWFDSRQSQLCIVMSYCEGGDLYKVLKERKGKGKLSEDELMEWFIQITLAVQYLHGKKILHRDLKTQNVFLTRSKLVKVGDLGIAKELVDDQMAFTLIGTPYYMSPEVFQNIPYSFKSDVWSLGCILFEMTSLKHAFTSHDFSSLVHKIINGEMPKIPSGYSRGVGELIEKMLQKDPVKRPTAQDILKLPFVQKNIEKFLKDSKKKQTRPSTASKSKRSPVSSVSRPKSANVAGRKASKSVKDEIDGATAEDAAEPQPEENNFFKDNQPTIKEKVAIHKSNDISPRNNSKDSKTAEDGIGNNKELDLSTEDFTLTPKGVGNSNQSSGKLSSLKKISDAKPSVLPSKQALPLKRAESARTEAVKKSSVSKSPQLKSPVNQLIQSSSKSSLGSSAPSTLQSDFQNLKQQPVRALNFLVISLLNV